MALGAGRLPAREVELPCCYEGELGTDLEAAASRLGLSVDDLVHGIRRELAKEGKAG